MSQTFVHHSGRRVKHLRMSKSFNCTRTWTNKSLLSSNQLRNLYKSGRKSSFTARLLKSADAKGRFGISYQKVGSRQKSLHGCLLYKTRYIIPHSEGKNKSFSMYFYLLTVNFFLILPLWQMLHVNKTSLNHNIRRHKYCQLLFGWSSFPRL